MPIIKTKVELAHMKAGHVLEILADDINFIEDIQEWCGKIGQDFIGVETENGIIKGYVRKK
jgi:TusA-related sulfurtransferase